MFLVLLLAMMASGLAYLVVERARLDRHRRAIPLLIAVTGTRGKTSVTRMLASVLRQSGRRVLAKTTGSEASFILPDGSEQVIRRRGRPSIIEQKHVLRLSAELGVDAAVVEVMSIHAENHRVEARHILKPDVVLATNLRVDHISAVGYTREAVASVTALDVPPGARAVVPKHECLPQFRGVMEEQGSGLVEVAPYSAPPVTGGLGLGADGFGENLDLIWEVTRSLGVDDATIIEGIRRAQPDVGALRIWRYPPKEEVAPCFLVSAFAANDPESTALVYERVIAAVDATWERCVGLLTLRHDRGDRTAQWVEALSAGFVKRFRRLYVLGLHARAVERRLRRCNDMVPVEVLRDIRPAEITRRALSAVEDGERIVFGFGNIGGAGEALVRHWSEVGEPWERAP